MKVRWAFGIVSGIFLAIFCLYPQLKMVYLRGDAWNGHYAYNDIDEAAYASYIKALIDGRPRKNDPYSGADESSETPQPESLFSIQFAAPYTVAVPARVLGMGAPWAMTLSGAIAGFLAALAGFWLIARMTGSNWFGMAGSLVMFAGGAVFAGEGALPEIFFDGFSYPYFPGFRRYIPAMAMPAIFGMFAVMWRLLEGRSISHEIHESNRKSKIQNPKSPTTPSADHPADESSAPLLKPGGELEAVQPETRHQKPVTFAYELVAILAAIFCFAYCVYSYFFIWTTAAAWLGAVGLMWLIFRPAGWFDDAKRLAVVAVGCAISLLPYAYLLSQRSTTMDDVQLLVLTRAPDLWRVPEYISVVCIVLIAFGVAAKLIGLRDRATLFTLATALVPLIVFNQQIITGRSLQPIHYQVFIGNYVAGLELVLTFGILLRKPLTRDGVNVKIASATLAVIAIFWGFVECHYTVRVLDEANVARDEAYPIGLRLEQLARDDPARFQQTALVFDSLFADDLPSIAPQNVLWARHQHVFAGLTWQQNKERYYRYLYFLGVDERGLDQLLKSDFVSQIALFGWGRHTDRLSFDAKPLTHGEITVEVQNYARFRGSFNAATAADPLLSYVVVNDEHDTDLSVVDQWYERYDTETIGKYTIYRVRQRN